jgi:hypothetical protein
MIAAGDAALASAKGKPKAFEYLGARASLQAAGGRGRCPTSLLLHGCWVLATCQTLDPRCLGKSKIFGISLFSNIRTPRGVKGGGGGPLMKL